MELLPTDIAIFESLLTVPYLTAEQLTHLHYSAGSLTYVKTKLKTFSDQKYLHRLDRPFPQYPYLHTLGRRGRLLLTSRGHTIPTAYPSEKRMVHAIHYPHTLLTNEVMVSALKLNLPNTTLTTIYHDFLIRGMMRGVRPDAFLSLSTNGEQIPLWVEISIDIKKEKFQKKIEGILQSVRGEYKQVFGTAFCTVVFLTPHENQLETMVKWTEEKLTEMGEAREADLFRFGVIPWKQINPVTLFTSQMHRIPFSEICMSLL